MNNNNNVNGGSNNNVKPGGISPSTSMLQQIGAPNQQATPNATNQNPMLNFPLYNNANFFQQQPAYDPTTAALLMNPHIAAAAQAAVASVAQKFAQQQQQQQHQHQKQTPQQQRLPMPPNGIPPGNPLNPTAAHNLVAVAAASNANGMKSIPGHPMQNGIQNGGNKNTALHRMPSNQAAPNGLVSAISIPMSNPLENMRNWSLEKLEAHVRLLMSTNQPIPQPLNLLLADARRKEEKRTAKRVANRRSACTSRARKKALVEEMTKTNIRLKRQALILSLLPDLVMAISIDGEINFCSDQVS